MVEIGYLNLLLTVYSGNEVISIQPFNVLIYDDYMGGAASFIELIQELQKMIENMAIDLNNAIKIPEKGKPNGVASLDKDGKIPLPQMPKEFQGFIDHITQTVFEHRVHGFSIDEDGMGIYQDDNGDWNYIGFSPDGNGGGATQLLDATISVSNGKATVTYEGIPTVVSSKWFTGDRKVEYFLLNGTSFTGNSFNVSALGTHTLYYKDSNGTEYVKTFNVTADMFNKPNVIIEVEDGYVTVTIPPTTNVSIKKWAKGSQTISYFTHNGTVFTGNSFQVTETGAYTVYIKTANGLEYVYTFTVTANMLAMASISVTVSNGVATVSHAPSSYVIATRKWAIGSHSMSHFGTGGTSYNGTTFNVSNTGNHTVFHRYTNGIETVKVFNVTQSMLPVKDSTPPTLTISQSQVSASLVRLSAFATDSDSGVKSITKPDGTVVNSSSTTFDVTANGTYVFNAMDNAGNQASQSIVVNTFDSIAPSITLSQSPTSWTNGNVTVSANIADNQSGVKTRKWASGDRAISYFTSSGTTFSGTSFTVSSNGVYTVYAIDNAGNASIKTIIISNIDKVAPTLNLSQTTSGSNKIITATYSDSGSGIYQLVKPDGTTATGTSSTYTATSNGILEFSVKDNAGNVTSKTINVTGLVVNTKTKFYVYDGTFYKIDTSGNVYAKGYNNSGEAGVGYATNATNSSGLENVTNISGVVEISGNFWLTKSGDVYKTGRNHMDGYGGYRKFVSSSGDYLTVPTKLPNVSNAIKIVGTSSSLLYQVSNGDWYALGQNGSGKLTIPASTSTQYITSPQKITAFSSQIKDVSLGGYEAIYTLTNGTVWFTGVNQITNEDAKTSPKQIAQLNNIAKGVNWWSLNSAMFINNSGNVYTYGRNRSGELGLGHTDHVTTPTLVSSLSNIKDIVAIDAFGFVIQNNSNQLYVTGTNGDGFMQGMLGKGNNEATYSSPSSLSFSGGTVDYVISDNNDVTFIITTAGRVYGFGSNRGNILNTSYLHTPTRLSYLE